ncbi:uncharacterized protein LOC135351537 [Halichondria panicea]|uniref:uncharacterized protein LOC135351537 n=1 Tax=Halichondria panicea TaxID=6063 RepID=UPI00312B9049
MGYTRPVSVLRIKSTVKDKYSRMSVKKLLMMITPDDNCDPAPIAQEPTSPVPQEVICEVASLQKSGLSLEDIVSRLRCRTVPTGYPIHPWRADEDEELPDKLRSILAQYEFAKTIKSWDAKGVPFSTYLYVPEVHPILKTVFHEREDEGHVYKRMGESTRKGGPDKMKTERYTEALYDPSTNLTYPALTGQRKQSIRDVEALFSKGVEDFMKRKGYKVEEEYIRAIRRWRLACDQRGLTQLQRCHYNYELLCLLLSDLMPWYKDIYDFSTLEVTRPTKGVLGLTRETVIALTTNIESREWRRRENRDPEHPRASTTDDVECIFSIMRDMVGNHFTLQCVKYNWRKVCNEFMKRLDPSLPFYYHTSTHDRFYEGDRPSFDEKRGTS